MLRQVEGANLAEGGWTGGDAWFGSVMSSIELMIRFKVYSTFIVKNNTSLYPMKVISDVLKARYPTRAAGHWVVFKSTIAGVPIFAIAYTWSNKRCSFMVSTCGKTSPHEKQYQTGFEDEWGNFGCRGIDRPEVCDFVYEFISLIDEHNKQRQGILKLEKVWKTHDAYFRLLTSILGFAIVDQHRWDRHRFSKWRESNQEEGKRTPHPDIIEYSDRISKWLNSVPRRLRASTRTRKSSTTAAGEELCRIIGANGSLNKSQTPSQLKKGRKGTGWHKTCFICRKYTKISITTTWECKACKMPLCKVSRLGNEGRNSNCIDEHLESECQHVGCWSSGAGIQSGNYRMPGHLVFKEGHNIE